MPEADRKTTILNAAMICFSRYGYARTKMDDIAQASAIARTALYKVYRNKTHIFNALVEDVHKEALAKASKALDGEEGIHRRLESALIARDTHLLSVGHSGPHADEIAQVYSTLAKDLTDDFNARLVDKVAEAIEVAQTHENYVLPSVYDTPHIMARLLRVALEGLKTDIKSIPEFENLARQMIKAMTH